MHILYLLLSLLIIAVSGYEDNGYGEIIKLWGFNYPVESTLKLGSISLEIGELNKLYELNLSYNNLSASIPSEVLNLESITDLILGSNELNGTISYHLIYLSHMTGKLDLSHNQFTGSIPVQIRDLIYLRDLDLSRNQLSGAILSKIENFTALEELLLNDNQFTGQAPQKICDLIEPDARICFFCVYESFDIRRNKLFLSTQATLKAIKP